jgi:hypothetical protein
MIEEVLALCSVTIKARGFQEHITFEGTAFEEQDFPPIKEIFIPKQTTHD